MPPFRTPAGDGDPPEQEWTPPDYAKPVEDSSEEWTPPSYAKAVTEEKPKKGWFSKPEHFNPKDDILHRAKGKVDEFLGSVLADKSSHPTIKRFLTSQDPAQESILPSIKQPETWGGGFRKGLYDEFIKPLGSAAGMAGMLGMGESPEIKMGENIPTKAAVEEPLPVRRNVRTDLTKRAIKDTTPQQDKVAIALTKDQVPRTPKNISDETGIPQPSVRRTMSELEKKSTTDQERLPISAKIFADEVPVKQADKLAKDPYEFAGESIRQPEVQARDFGYNERDSAGLERPVEETKQPPIQQPSQVLVPEKIQEPLKAQEFKPWNPFEKKTSADIVNEIEPPNQEIEFRTLRDLIKPRGTTISSLGAGQGDELLRIAKETGEDIKSAAKRLGFDPTEEELQDLYSKAGKIGLAGLANEKPSPTRSPNLDPNLYKLGSEPTGMHGRSDEDILYDIARNKFNMGKDMPSGERWIPPAQKQLFKDMGMTDTEIYKMSPEQSDALFESEWKKQPPENLDKGGTELDTANPSHMKVLKQNLDDAAEGWKPPEYAKAVEEAPKEELQQAKPEDITEMHGGLGGIKPSSRVLEPNSGPYGKALDSLFSSMGKIKEARVSQDIINKTERARRFAKMASVKEEGVIGAAKSLSAMKGEFEKVDLDRLKMTQPQVDSLMTAVKRAKLTDDDRLKGYSALFKLFNGEGVPQRNELAILDEVFGNSFADKIIEMHGGIGAVGLKVAKLTNTAKTMNNMFSLAPAMRHGAGFAARKEFAPAVKDMFKFYGNKEFFDASQQAMKEHPDFIKFKEAGGFFSESGSVLKSEEEFLNSYIGSFPRFTGIPQSAAASTRSYTGLMNKLRFDTTTNMFKTAESLGHKMFTDVDFVDTSDVKVINRLKKFARDNKVSDNIKNPEFIDLAKKNGLTKQTIVATKEAKAIARYNNIVSGRGELPFNLDRVTNELNMILFSPKMMASRIQLLTNPKIYTDLPKGMRLDGLKALLGIASIGTITSTMSLLAGAKIGTNILSTDFMKSRFGNNNVVDPWGGMQQYVVAAARFLAGKTDDPKPVSRGEIVGRLLKSHEAPGMSFVHDLAFTQKFTGQSDDPKTAGDYVNQYGQKTNMQTEALKKFSPILIQDLYDILHSDPKFSENIGLDVAMAGASLAGMSQNYPERKPKGLQIRKLGKLK